MFLPIKYQRHTLAREKYYFSNTFYSSLFSIKKSNSEKLDELVKKFNAKSRSVIIDMLIEKSEL